MGIDKFASNQKMITCILPKGVAAQVVEALRREHGIINSTVNYARGAGHLTPAAHRGAGEETEKEILKVVASAGEAEALFDWLYETARINRPHGGVMYMSRLQACTPFSLPDMEWER